MDCISGWCKSQRRLDGYTVIITGSNAGIGKETALDLYRRGAKIIMACRDIKKAEMAKEDIEKEADLIKVGNEKQGELVKGSLILEQLDLCSLKSIQDFSHRVLEKEPRIQILINNAGVMMCPEGRTEDGFETQMGSNHIGHAYLTLLLLPRLIKSAPSRIICLSSLLHEKNDVAFDDMNFEKTPYNAYVAYCRSKAANVLFARALALKLKEHNMTGVTTYSVHPGVISTGIARHYDQTMGYGTSWLFNRVLSWFIKSPRCGAQTTIYCAVDEACANETGLYYSDCAVKTPSKQCRSDEEAEKLWAVTVELLKSKLPDYNPFVVEGN
ncbi:retinol dehydrogenase 11-like isoform X2 [Manduca sexta]|uniref:retinol dehydrogenase 11-like isoform X2 n=1 Tax=Manduca sexta TaxID=7130 RepID=UPI001182307B|nr:retinol dehydrogenase 11-like isoform X2 [Manduca sexta]